MFKSSIVKRIIVFVTVVTGLIICNSFSSGLTTLTKTGVTSAQWKQIPAGILVWSCKTSGMGLQVDLYNNDLQLIASYSKTLKKNFVNDIELFYCGNSYCEFLLRDIKKKQNTFLRLDFQLKEIFVSLPFTTNKKEDDSIFTLSPTHFAKTIANYRQDNFEWEISNDTIRDIDKKLRTKTFLQMSEEMKTETLPVFKKKWKFEFAPAFPEYAKIFLHHNGKIFAYVNFKTESGEQYIYCLNDADGSLIYKTKLSLSARQDWSDNKSKVKMKACIFSNFYLDSIHKKLFIGGTCLYPTNDKFVLGATGVFLMQLNPEGKITAAFGDDDYYLMYPSYKDRDGIFQNDDRNFYSYSRLVAMSIHPDASFSVVTESYSLIRDNKKTAGTYVGSFNDSCYHYLTLENMWYDVSLSDIKPYCTDCVVKVIPWLNNPHLDSIDGFISKQTLLVDRSYRDDINFLNDPDVGDHYFVGSIFNDSTNTTKVLIKDSVKAGGIENEIYFQKSITGSRAKNCQTFQSAVPIRGQDMKTHPHYFLRDEKTLFKFTTSNSGYTLELVNW